MRKRIFSVTVFVIVVLTGFAAMDIEFEIIEIVEGPIIHVPTDFPTIQEAIDGASVGDTVFVHSGEYFEHVIIDKSISLVGEGRYTTVINGSGYGDVVTVVSDYVNISEFTISCSGNKYYNIAPGRDAGDAGIQIDSNYNLIFNNLFIFDYLTIYLNYSNGNKVFQNNFKYNTEVCWAVHSHDNIFKNNRAVSNKEGMNFFWSDNNIIKDNFVANPMYYHSGIHLVESCNNEVLFNTVHYAWQGFYIESSSNNNNISGNNASHNKYGIRLARADYNKVVENTAYDNDGCGFLVIDSTNNYIYHNNIISNVKQAQDNFNVNFWDNGYPSGGNYWSDYSGVDFYKGSKQNIPGADGIGDTNYTIDFDSIDNYPLIGPYNCTIIITPPPYVLYLKQGWNLISFPLIQNRTDIKTVLQSIEGDYDSVQWYDASDDIDPWKHYKVGKPYGNDLTDLNEKMGFWIYITSPGGTTLVINGSLPSTPQYILLHKGWNLVGYPSTTSRLRNEALNNLHFIYQIRTILYYNTNTGRIEKLDQNEFMKPGLGYWIYAHSDYVWEVPL